MDYTKRNYATQASTSYNEGLRSFMLAVYNFMAVGLGITGLMAYALSLSPSLMMAIFTTPLQWVVIFAPLVMVFFVMPRIMTFSVTGAQISFGIFAALMGVSLSSIFLVYTGESITRVFFITAATFGAMSLYGYTTKRDLSAMGSFLIMGLIGIIIASLVNIFLQSAAIQFITSVLGVLIFTGLTAYDTQRIKEMYNYYSGSAETATKMAIVGALALYMDFINLFISLLQLLGDRK
jgi:uncharacterized protein